MKLGKNARKKLLRASIAEFDRYQLDGRAPTALSGTISKRQAQSHQLSSRFKWEGAGHRDGSPHATRTFIRKGMLATRPIPFLKYQRTDGK